MSQTCHKHGFEVAEAMCRRCGEHFCSTCLVYAFGPKQAPFCVSCAILAAGVRSTAGVEPRKSAREVRRELRAQRKAAKLAKRNGHGSGVNGNGHPELDGDDLPARDAAFEAEVAAWRDSEQLWQDA